MAILPNKLYSFPNWIWCLKVSIIHHLLLYNHISRQTLNILRIECRGGAAELVLVVDQCVSVNKAERKKTMEFLDGIVEKFDISPSHARVGEVWEES